MKSVRGAVIGFQCCARPYRYGNMIASHPAVPTYGAAHHEYCPMHLLARAAQTLESWTDPSRTQSGLTTDFVLKWNDKNGIRIQIKLLKRSQWSHLASNASLLAELLAWVGWAVPHIGQEHYYPAPQKPCLDSSTPCGSSKAYRISTERASKGEGAVEELEWIAFCPGFCISSCALFVWLFFFWHLFTTATELMLMGMSLKALKYICMHHLPCHCECEWRKWEKWPFLIRSGQHSTTCGSGDMGLTPSTALCSWEGEFSQLQHYHSFRSWPCPSLLCFRGSTVCCCLLKSKKGAILQIAEL